MSALGLSEDALRARLERMSLRDLRRLAPSLVRLAGSPEAQEIVRRVVSQREKRQIPHDLAASIAALPRGRRRVAQALLNGEEAPTYGRVARELGVGPGTVSRHLRRLRLGHPDLYAAIMAERRRQLEDRHAAVAERQAERSRRWHRRRANARYRERFGRSPWEGRA